MRTGFPLSFFGIRAGGGDLSFPPQAPRAPRKEHNLPPSPHFRVVPLSVYSLLSGWGIAMGGPFVSPSFPFLLWDRLLPRHGGPRAGNQKVARANKYGVPERDQKSKHVHLKVAGGPWPKLSKKEEGGGGQFRPSTAAHEGRGVLRVGQETSVEWYQSSDSTGYGRKGLESPHPGGS